MKLGRLRLVGAVFFDVETAYDMLWKEGLLIKLETMGIGGRMFNWIKNFFERQDYRGKS